jgi:hypothetical protein
VHALFEDFPDAENPQTQRSLTDDQLTRHVLAIRNLRTTVSLVIPQYCLSAALWQLLEASIEARGALIRFVLGDCRVDVVIGESRFFHNCKTGRCSELHEHETRNTECVAVNVQDCLACLEFSGDARQHNVGVILARHAASPFEKPDQPSPEELIFGASRVGIRPEARQEGVPRRTVEYWNRYRHCQSP